MKKKNDEIDIDNLVIPSNAGVVGCIASMIAVVVFAVFVFRSCIGFFTASEDNTDRTENTYRMDKIDVSDRIYTTLTNQAKSKGHL
jgi:hypothetical protein